MERRMIIDGYNLIFQIPELRRWLERDMEAARNALIRQLSAYALKNEMKITLVFDGDEFQDMPQQAYPHLQVIYSHFPEKADPLIKQLISQDRENDSLQIVSSDKEIREFARLMSVPEMTSQSFALMIQAENTVQYNNESFSPEMTREEAARWMTLFSKDRGEDQEEDK